VRTLSFHRLLFPWQNWCERSWHLLLLPSPTRYCLNSPSWDNSFLPLLCLHTSPRHCLSNIRWCLPRWNVLSGARAVPRHACHRIRGWRRLASVDFGHLPKKKMIAKRC
jgi:hypothetical protein